MEWSGVEWSGVEWSGVECDTRKYVRTRTTCGSPTYIAKVCRRSWNCKHQPTLNLDTNRRPLQILPEDEDELEDEEWDENWRTPAAYFDEDGRVSEADRSKRLEEAGVPRIDVLLNGYLVQRTLDSRKKYERSKVGSMIAGPKMGHSHLVPEEDVEKAIRLDGEYDAQLNANRVLGAFVTRLLKRRCAGA